MGCRVVGIVGNESKRSYIVDVLGFDHGINYKTANISEELKLSCPDGIDVYFDNVGGMNTDAVLSSLNLRARVVICGQISQYDGSLDNPELGPRFLHQLLYKRATIQGILARDFTHRMPEMINHILPWLKAGEIQFKTTEINGFENLPSALEGLFEGKNIGKAIVRVK